MPKILVVHASFGQGHKQAALAISSHLKVPCHDLLDFAPGFMKKIQSSAYLYVTKNFPFGWKFFFDISQHKLVVNVLKFLNLITYFPFITYLKKNKPDIIITTHFFPPQLLSILKKRIGSMLISVVTDIKPHRLWAESSVDKFFVATKQTKKWLIDLGINKEKIIPGYVSIRKGFLKKEKQSELYQKFNLDPSRQSILFVSSASGNFQFLEDTLKNLSAKFNLLIIHGKNAKLKKYLDQLQKENIKYFHFYQKIWELISISSVIVTKPGGLTVFEGGYKKKPFVFTHFIPGQEEDNMNFLKKRGVAMIAHNAKDLIESIIHLAEKEKILKDNYPLEFKDIRKPLDEIINNYVKNC